jgi:hypothetical protein
MRAGTRGRSFLQNEESTFLAQGQCMISNFTSKKAESETYLMPGYFLANYQSN